MKVCSIEGCGKKCHGKGYCKPHYDSLRNNGVPKYERPPFIDPGCKIPGCEKNHKGKGLCAAHLWCFREHGDPLHSVPAAREEQKWVGDLRVCSNCGNHKTPENFYPHSGTGRLVDKCKKCISDKGKLRSYEELRCKNLKQNYNLTHEEWLKINESQNGVCAICKKPEMRRGRPLSVDHDHQTGKIRGLLCSNCNTALGLLRDSIPNLSEAIDYLKRSDSGTQK